MSAELLLSRLEYVQRSGKGWRCACPACGGRSRKLSISEADEGRLLVHCFGGCDVLSVVQAAGLELTDLFPERLSIDTPDDRKRRLRLAREYQWGAALESLDLESTIVLLAAQQLQEGEPLSDEDALRFLQAIKRIDGARQVLRDYPRWNPKEQAS